MRLAALKATKKVDHLAYLKAASWVLMWAASLASLTVAVKAASKDVNWAEW